MRLLRFIAPFAALAVLAGCTTGPSGTEVTRFHLGAPIARSTISLVPNDANQSFGLEYRSYADAVATELARQNFIPVGNDPTSAYIGTISIGQVDRRGATRSSGFSIGLGGGSFGRGGGIGGGVSLPVGGRSRTDVIRANTLALQIRRRADGSIVWEGRATAEADTRRAESALPNAIPGLAHALLADFPGAPGQTVHVPASRR